MSDVYGGNVVEQIDGESVEFPRLTNKQVETVENIVRSKIRAQTDADSEGLPNVERSALRNQRVPVFVAPELVDAFIATSEGARTVLEASLKNSAIPQDQKTAALDKLGQNPLRASEVARDVMGFLDGERIARRLLAALKRIDELTAAQVAGPQAVGSTGSEAA